MSYLKFLYILPLFLSVLYSCSSQKITDTDNNPKIVKGIVVDNVGFPLEGAIIWVKGFSEGQKRFTGADVEGKFEIEVKKGKVLLVKFWGLFVREVIIKNKINK